MTPLFMEFLKNNQKNVQQRLRHRQHRCGRRTAGLPTEWHRGHACPLEKALGPTVRGRPPFRGAPGMEEPDQPARPT